MKPEVKDKEYSKNVFSIALSGYVRPDIKEDISKGYALNGKDNIFYDEIIDAYNGSPTNSAIIDGYSKFIYGKGLVAKDPMYQHLVDEIFDKKQIKRICKDFATFGEAALEGKRQSGALKIWHVPKQNIAPSIENEDGEIESQFYCKDWKKKQKYPPEEFDNFDYKPNSKSFICVISDYQIGQRYFANPSYISSLPYAKIEEELANYYINHIKNGLSFGHIINFNNGNAHSEEEKERIVDELEKRLTGSTNANRRVYSFNDNKDHKTTIEALEVSDAHQQYQFLSSEAKQMIMIAHKVTSPILFGIKDNTGFGNNAEEMKTAFDELMANIIQPQQEIILDTLMEILKSAGIVVDLDFIPLRVNDLVNKTDMHLSKNAKTDEIDLIADGLIELGEYVDDTYELVDERDYQDKDEITEVSLRLAASPQSYPNSNSEMDNELFKVRYIYRGNDNPQREFCRKVMQANKVYRKEDLIESENKVINKGFGPNGSDKYSILKYKGGVNCKHFWQRQIYLKKDNEIITASQLRSILNRLEPEERRKVTPKPNEFKETAQIADSGNNYWRLAKQKVYDYFIKRQRFN